MSLELEVRNVPIKLINIKDNSRIAASHGLADLMTSMKQSGQLQPVGLTPAGSRYDYVWGNRRIVAAKKLGWDEISAVIKVDLKPEDQLLLNIEENIHRREVSPHEIGRYFSKLHTEFGLSYEQIGARCSASAALVARNIELFKRLPETFAADIKKGSRSGLNASAAINVIKMVRQKVISKADADELYRAVRDQTLQSRDLTKVALMVYSQKVPVRRAIKSIKKTVRVDTQFFLDANEYERFKEETKEALGAYLRKVLKSKYPRLLV